MTDADPHANLREIARCLRRLLQPCRVARHRPVSMERVHAAIQLSRRALAASENAAAVELSEASPPGWQLCALAMVVAHHDAQERAEADCRRGLSVSKVEARLERLGYEGVTVDRRSRIVRRRFIAIDRTLEVSELRLGALLERRGAEGHQETDAAPRHLAATERTNRIDERRAAGERSHGEDHAGDSSAARGQRRRRGLRTDEDFFTAASGLARTVMGIEDGPNQGWGRDSSRARRKRRSARIAAMFEESREESAEDFRRQLDRLSRYERRHPELPTATLGRVLQVTPRQRFVMWILLTDRMHCSDEMLGYSVGQLANFLGFARPAELAKMCELLDRDGPLAQGGFIRHLEEDCRLIDSRLTITNEFAQKMLGEHVSLKPFLGKQSERASANFPPWMRPPSAQREQRTSCSKTPPPSRPLVLPEAPMRALRRAIAQVPLRKQVAEEMGYGALIGYGLGSVFLFEGAPGTGKTLAASVVAHELDRPLLKVGASELLDAFVGGTETQIQQVFQDAKRSGSVLLLDEADSLLGAREHAVRTWEVSQVNTLLHCLEQFDGVVVLTTNFVGRLDSALERRISLRLRFDPPGPRERQQIWNALVGERFQVAPEELERVARTQPLTGSQIKSAVLELAMVAIGRPDRTVSGGDISDAVRRATRATSSMSPEVVAGF